VAQKERANPEAKRVATTVTTGGGSASKPCFGGPSLKFRGMKGFPWRMKKKKKEWTDTITKKRVRKGHLRPEKRLLAKKRKE